VRLHSTSSVSPRAAKNTKVSSGATQKYLKQLEENLLRHRLIECLGQLHTTYKISTLLPEGPQQAGQAEPGDHAERGEEMLKDKIWTHPVLPQGRLLDPSDANLPVAP
jgi:hypothetical protein